VAERRRKRGVAVPEGDEGIVNERALTSKRGVELWQEMSRHVASGRDRMLAAEKIMLGETKLVPPKHLKRSYKDVDLLIPSLHLRKSLVLNVTNALSEERPTIHRQRPPKGGTTADQRAEETETALNALLLALFPWDDSVGRSVQHGNYLIVTMLAEDLWDADIDFMDSLSEDEWKQLSASERRSYAQRGQGKDARYERPKTQYWRDAQDRGVESKDYGRRDPKKTRQAYLDAVEDHLAQNPPFAIRGYSAFDFVPIRDASGLQGAIVRQLMDPSTLLRKGYRAKGLEEAAAGRVLIPTGVNPDIWGREGKVYLYHFYIWIDGDPCVAYLVGGQDTDVASPREDGGEDRMDAFINLREKWGFTRLPIGDYYGLHLQTDKLGDRPVPLLDPIGPLIVAAEGAYGAANITGWRRGTSKYTTVPAPNVPPSAYIEQKTGALKQIDLDQDGDIVTVFGPVGMLAPLEQSDQSLAVADRYMQAVAEAAPAAAAFGGTGSESGRQAALLHTFMQSANRMIPEGLRQAYEDCASYLLEWACCLMRERNISEIPYYTAEEVDPQEGADEAGERTVVVRLVESWIGKNYRVKAEVAPVPNPVLIEQEVSLADKGYGSFEDVQRARGKRNVLRERVKTVNDAHWRSEAGLAELRKLDAQRRGDIEKARQYQAFLAQDAAPLEVDQKTGQVALYGPSAAMDPMFQGQGGGGPTSAQASYAGTIGAGRGAEMQDLQQIAQAGMALPGGAPGAIEG
jgi:hypothetical protein